MDFFLAGTALTFGGLADLFMAFVLKIVGFPEYFSLPSLGEFPDFSAFIVRNLPALEVEYLQDLEGCQIPARV